MSRFGPDWPDADDGVGAPDTSAARFSASLAFGVAVAAAVGIGAAVGSPFAAVAAAVGAAVVGWSAGELDDDDNARRAVGSVGVIVGTTLLAAALGLFGGARFVGTAATLALVAVALDRYAGLTEDTVGDVARAVVHSGIVVACFGLLALLAYLRAVGLAAVAVVGLFSALSRASALVPLLVVELEVLFVALTVKPAVDRLERLDPADRVTDRLRALDAVAVHLTDVPRGVWAVVAGTAYLAASSWGRSLFDGFLASLSTLGAAVSALLLSGVLTGSLGLLAAFVLTVFAADACRSLLVFWLGADPPETLAAAAGGAAVGGLVFAAGLVPPVAAAVDAALPPTTILGRFVAGYGVGATLLGVVAAGLFVVLVVVAVVASVVQWKYVPPAAGGFALGSGLLFVAGLLSATADAAALVTVAAVGAALLVWDLGENAVDVGATLGRDAETRRAEAVHAAGSVAVVAAAVGLAAVSLYVLGPLSVPAGRARLALLFALAAFLALAVATTRE